MGRYNTLWAEVPCPRCEHSSRVSVQTYVGELMWRHYELGEAPPWRDGVNTVSGGRPLDDTCESQGYAECLHCGKDFFAIVYIVDGVFSQVLPDVSLAPLDPDDRLPRRLTCPRCETTGDGELYLFRGYSIGAYSCEHCGVSGQVDLPFKVTGHGTRYKELPAPQAMPERMLHTLYREGK